MRLVRSPAATVGLLFLLHSIDAHAQEGLAIRSDVLFYGDNTEFHNPFREGETLLGAALSVAAVVDLNDRVHLSLGAFGNQRFGSERAFELWRPVVSLSVTGARSVFVFGTLPLNMNVPLGPDRAGPHGLLPPIQRETFAYERPYEAGLGWKFMGQRLRHEFWLDWQRLNTPEHRERFDGGINTSWRLTNLLFLPVQMQVVHEGGQLFSSGPVVDSAAAAAGAQLQGRLAGDILAGVELFGSVSRNVPDRSRPELSRDGTGFFARASGEKAGWRGHVIFWRGRNFIKEEGDPNYMSLTLSGARYRGTRDYAEIGLSRRFYLAQTAFLDVSGRLHRVENHYEYSYRVTSAVTAFWRIR